MNSDFRARPGGACMGSHKSGRWWKEDSKPKASVSYIVRLSRKQIKPRNPDLTGSFHPSLRENYHTIIWLLIMYNKGHGTEQEMCHQKTQARIYSKSREIRHSFAWGMSRGTWKDDNKWDADSEVRKMKVLRKGSGSKKYLWWRKDWKFMKTAVLSKPEPQNSFVKLIKTQISGNLPKTLGIRIFKGRNLDFDAF